MEWIRVEERLPEEGVEVLCDIGMRDIDNIPKYQIGTYRIFKNKSCFVTGPYMLDDVKFWMPLPQPPKE